MLTNNFQYSQGGNKLADLRDFINGPLVSDSQNPSITGSFSLTGSMATNVLTIVPISASLTLPNTSSLPTGSLVISGSGAAAKLYMYNGTNWMSSSAWSVI